MPAFQPYWENPPYGMIGGIEETSASFEARSAPRSYPTNYGANLICAKADVARSSTGTERYCRENPGSDVVPMSATGHATIYSWECIGNKARIKSGSVPVDIRGFIANQWKRLGE